MRGNISYLPRGWAMTLHRRILVWLLRACPYLWLPTLAAMSTSPRVVIISFHCLANYPQIPAASVPPFPRQRYGGWTGCATACPLPLLRICCHRAAGPGCAMTRTTGEGADSYFRYVVKGRLPATISPPGWRGKTNTTADPSLLALTTWTWLASNLYSGRCVWLSLSPLA